MYYDVTESGRRIQKLRTARGMTRQELAEAVGLSVDALRKVEKGTNGAKIDTLIGIAEVFHVSLDYLACGREDMPETDGLFAGLGEAETEFVRRIVLHAIENIGLLKG